jgi:hypothetical protein
MATKCIVLGEQPKEIEKKPIEFKKFFDRDLATVAANTPPNRYMNVELITLKYTDNWDLMFAYDGNRNDGILYLGHWNDGFVE